MRSLRIILLLLILLPLAVEAQKENYIWYFGDSMGLDFNSGIPVPVSSSMYTSEGCASICDGNGRLLFYTNGIDVWNKKHTIMPGGHSIGGDYDDAQSALILQLPGKSNIYYIFTNDKYHIAYSIVDMNADNGNGDIIRKDVTIMRNPNEGLAAALHCNGRDHWVVAQSLNNNRFCAFLFNSKGLQPTPVITEAGATPLSSFGMIKFSPQSDKVAILKDLDREVYQFDRKSGKLGKSIFSIRYSVNGRDFLLNYGFEFSPDGNKLYFSGWGPHLFQFDLTAGDSTAILNSRYGIHTDWPYQWAIALGPDNRLYVTVDKHYIDVIKNPNAKGTACNYTEKAIYLGDKQALIGLPNFPAGGNSISAHTVYDISTRCNSQTVQLSIKDTSNVDSVKWFITNTNGSYIYNSGKWGNNVVLPDAGKYYITLLSFSSCGNDTFKDSVTIYPLLKDTTWEYSICPGSSIRIGSFAGMGSSYQWSTGSSDSSIVVNIPGTYQLTIQRGNCQAVKTYIVKNYPDIWTALGQEYYICDDDKELVKLDAGKGFVHYMWYPTGDSTQWIMVDRLGSYYVVVKDFRGCNGSDSTIVKRKCPGHLYFPNAFTPNADGHNDLYLPDGLDVLSYHLRIYNRWGEMVFETNELSEGWNGEFKGAKAAEGTYLWMSEYTLLNENKLENKFYKNGTLQLIR